MTQINTIPSVLVLKFSFSKKATKICVIFLIGFDVYKVKVKTMKKITQFFVVFSEKLNFTVLKSLRNKKDLNDVTAAQFLVSFSQLPAAKKNTENWAAVTSLRSSLIHDNSKKHKAPTTKH